MSQLYARVFTRILDSSIAEDYQARHIFEDFLKVCTTGENGGVVDMTREALSRRFNIPLKQLNDGIAKLEAPDPKSRDGTKDGRRLERLDDHRDWGWRIVNWTEYDKIRTQAEVAARVARHRAVKTLLEYHRDAAVVLQYLNDKSGRKFREVDSNLKFISARLNEKDITLDGVRKMIDRQCARWLGTDQEEYLRPETLFNETKFDGYYAAKDQPVAGKPKAPTSLFGVEVTNERNQNANAQTVGQHGFFTQETEMEEQMKFQAELAKKSTPP